MSVLRCEVHCLNEVLEDGLGDEVVEVDACPAGLDALAAVADFPLELVGSLDIDPKSR